MSIVYDRKIFSNTYYFIEKGDEEYMAYNFNSHLKNTQSDIFIDGVLNLFTDASIEPLGGNKWNGCAGVVAAFRNYNNVDENFFMGYLNNDFEDFFNVVNLKIMFDCTNNIAELSAILLGVEFAIEHQSYFKRINLFSDSRISVQSLRDWIFNWIQYSRYKNQEYNPSIHTLINTTGCVKNQVLIKNIINGIAVIDPKLCSFNIYHCKGHAKNIKTVQDTFQKFNGFRINNYDAEKILECNDMVDNATREYLLSHRYRDEDIINVIPFTIDPSQDIMNIYHSIMKGG